MTAPVVNDTREEITAVIATAAPVDKPEPSPPPPESMPACE